MNKNSKNNYIKFLSGRGPKSLPLTVFLAEKTEPNYDTADLADSLVQNMCRRVNNQWVSTVSRKIIRLSFFTSLDEFLLKKAIYVGF